MPQFNFEDFPPQLIWLAITFIVFYLIMSRSALPRIADVLEQRRDRIQRDIDEAERLRSETERAITAYEQALAEARNKAHGIGQETRDKLTADVDRERRSLEKQLNERLADAETRINTAKTAALSEVSKIGAETAGAIVEQLIGVKPSGGDIEAAAAKFTPKR